LTVLCQATTYVSRLASVSDRSSSRPINRHGSHV